MSKVLACWHVSFLAARVVCVSAQHGLSHQSRQHLPVSSRHFCSRPKTCHYRRQEQLRSRLCPDCAFFLRDEHVLFVQRGQISHVTTGVCKLYPRLTRISLQRLATLKILVILEPPHGHATLFGPFTKDAGLPQRH